MSACENQASSKGGQEAENRNPDGRLEIERDADPPVNRTQRECQQKCSRLAERRENQRPGGILVEHPADNKKGGSQREPCHKVQPPKRGGFHDPGGQLISATGDSAHCRSFLNETASGVKGLFGGFPTRFSGQQPIRRVRFDTAVITLKNAIKKSFHKKFIPLRRGIRTKSRGHSSFAAQATNSRSEQPRNRSELLVQRSHDDPALIIAPIPNRFVPVYEFPHGHPAILILKQMFLH